MEKIGKELEIMEIRKSKRKGNIRNDPRKGWRRERRK